ncbi:MAG: PEP-CTERM sorting domain-containing protein [Planctomycetota bacterium]|nr:PEP-CTERM sorting domain-containing protein [Planctomycetota bacterium]
MRTRYYFGVPVLALAFLVALAPSATAGVWNVDSGGPVPAWGSAHFTFTVSGEGSIVDLDLRVSLAQNYDRSLEVIIKSPAGTKVEVIPYFSATQRLAGSNLQETCFDDEAVTSIYSGTPPYAGTYRPLYALSAFDAQNPNGIWDLVVLEHADVAFGTLYRAGDTAPWGAAVGTQLILTPEPATVALVALGGLGMLARRKRK